MDRGLTALARATRRKRRAELLPLSAGHLDALRTELGLLAALRRQANPVKGKGRTMWSGRGER